MEFNGTLLVVIISFFLFMVLMKGVYFDPIQRIQQERADKLANDAQNAATFSDEEKRLQAAYDAALSEARKKAQQLIQTHREEGRQKANGVTQQARTKAQQNIEWALGELRAAKDGTLNHLLNERHSLKDLILNRLHDVHAGVGQPVGSAT